MARQPDPVILVTSYNTTGHFIPLLQIAGYLVSRKYDVWFLAPRTERESIESVGCTFVPTVGASTAMIKPVTQPGYVKKGIENLLFMYRDLWASSMPCWLESLRTAMAAIRRENPGREIVIVMDTINPGIIPLKMGAELPEGFTTLPKTMGISIIPPIFSTADRGPWGLGLPYDTSDAARIRNIALCQMFRTICEPVVEATNLMLRAAGIMQPIDSIFGSHGTVPHIPVEAGIMCHDVTLQMCIPSLDYGLEEFPSHVKFGGTLPPKPLNANFSFPSWFRDLIANSATERSGSGQACKKIIVAAQGTFAVDYSDVIIPTIHGLESRDDLILVAVLGVRGATLDANFPDGLPSNTIVVDYFPYDPLIEHADVFVTNGSYGAFSHAVAHGVPMVLAGHSEDKVEIGMRGERSGFAVNLHTGTPTPECVAVGVNTVLKEPHFKLRAMQLKKEAEEFRCLETVERELISLF